jgi:hypothetical protein
LSSMFKTKLNSSASMGLRLSVVPSIFMWLLKLQWVPERMNVLWMTEKFKQYIQDCSCNAHTWWEVKCGHRTFADLGHATKCASSNAHLHSLLTFPIISSMFLFQRCCVCV